MFKLDGRVALVTGGAGKFGSQMVRALCEAGATVYTASRRLEPNEEFASALRGEGFDVRAESYDQSDEESIKALLARIVEQSGKDDILDNNSELRFSRQPRCISRKPQGQRKRTLCDLPRFRRPYG